MLNLTRLGLQAFLGAIAIQMVSSLMGTAVASIAPEVARGLSADSTFAGLYIGCLYVGASLRFAEEISSADSDQLIFPNGLSFLPPVRSFCA